LDIYSSHPSQNLICFPKEKNTFIGSMEYVLNFVLMPKFNWDYAMGKNKWDNEFKFIKIIWENP
jgi:hypothetical protein